MTPPLFQGSMENVFVISPLIHLKRINTLWLLCSKPCWENTFVWENAFVTSLFKGSIWKTDLLFPFSMWRDYICHFSFVPKLCQENAVVTSKFQNFVRRVHLWLLLCSMSAFMTSPLFHKCICDFSFVPKSGQETPYIVIDIRTEKREIE